MLTGIKYKAYPTSHQKLVLSQWMGCARSIWNSKCEESGMWYALSKKEPIGTYKKPNKQYAHLKDRVIAPWLFECPSKILANEATNWCRTQEKAIKGVCGFPKKKKKSNGGSIWLTEGLFCFEEDADGNQTLFIGQKRNNIGLLKIKIHKTPDNLPKSIRITKKAGIYWVSFSYEDGKNSLENSLENLREDLKEYGSVAQQGEFLETAVIGIDSGVVNPFHSGERVYDFDESQKRSLNQAEKYLKRYQRRMARQQKGSKRREKTKGKIGRQHLKIKNIRNDFAHKTSRSLVSDPNALVFIFENLKIQNMTKRAKPKKDVNGKYIKNGAAAKSGLNKAILEKGWYKVKMYTLYKANREGKYCFSIGAHYTSQECATCGHTHPDNRKTQSDFLCIGCGYSEDADRNASDIIKKRAIQLILYSGTELSKGLLGKSLDTGRGANVRLQNHKSGIAAVATKR